MVRSPGFDSCSHSNMPNVTRSFEGRKMLPEAETGLIGICVASSLSSQGTFGAPGAAGISLDVDAA